MKSGPRYGYNVPPLFSADFTYHRHNLYLKHALDRVVATVALVCLSPVFAGIALAIMFEGWFVKGSRGPVLVVERRISAGHPFSLIKFRTFYRQDDELQRDLAGTTDFINKRRTTRVGKLLRRHYLDELPQFINILKGEMSIVGPRPWPERQHDAILAEGFQAKRLLRGGLCGPTQGLKGQPTKQASQAADPEELLVQEYLSRSPLGVVLCDLRQLRDTFRVFVRGEGL